MKVVQLTAFHVRIPLKKPIRHASHARTSTDNVVVRCVLDDGTEGFGEGVPREYVTGETIDTCLELLKTSELPAQVHPCQDFFEAVALASRLRLRAVPGDERGCQGNAARCALELAFLDACCQHYRYPLAAVTDSFPEVYGRRDWVRYSGAIMSAEGFKARLASWKMRLYGFQQIKVKVGIPGQNDVERLRIIRRRLGKNIDLRVDANEAWSPGEAVERIRELEPFGISSVEQPVAHEHVAALAAIRRQVKTPIMLDESLCSMYDAKRALALRACDLFNLRLSKCGGFIPTLRLVSIADQEGVGYQLGCQVGETAILSAAGRHFATSVERLRHVEGSFDRHLVREPLGTTDLTFGWGGWAPALAGPGLGITVDPAALARVTVRKEALLG